MAFEQQGFDQGYLGSTNVTALSWTGNPPVYASGGIPQYSVVIPDTSDGTNGAVTLAANATTLPLGISQDGPAIGPGQAVNVRYAGYSKAVAGGAITYGQQVVANASGQVVAASALGATNQYIVGQAETAATQAGDLITVRLSIGATLVNA